MNISVSSFLGQRFFLISVLLISFNKSYSQFSLNSGGGSYETSLLNVDYSIGQITGGLFLADSTLNITTGVIQGGNSDNTSIHQVFVGSKIQVYPIPFEQSLWITARPELFKTITITDLLGKVVFESPFTNQLFIDKQVEPGTYLIQLIGQTTITQKIVKQ